MGNNSIFISIYSVKVEVVLLTFIFKINVGTWVSWRACISVHASMCQGSKATMGTKAWWPTLW